MKPVSLFLAILLFSCNGIDALNEKIYEAQLKAIRESPYKSAKGTAVYVEAQREFRLNNLPKLITYKLKQNTLAKDTLWMTESFDAICTNCASDWMKILFKDTVYSIRKAIAGGKNVHFETQIEPFNPMLKDFDYELRNSEFIEIVPKVRNKETWIANPLQYGADNCNDGDHTLFTVIYPDERIESMYVRCWMPSFYRGRK